MSWALSATLLGALLYWATLSTVNGRQRPGEPPLVSGHLPFLGVGLAFARDAMAYIARCRERHGDVFTLYVAGQRMTFVLDPLSCPVVLKAKTLSFAPIADGIVDKAFGFPEVRARLDLERLEALARTLLRGDELPPLTSRMEKALRRQLAARRCSGEREIDLYRLVWDLVFAAGTDALFGEGLTDTDQAFAELDRAFPVMAAGLPRWFAKRGHQAREKLAYRLAETGADPSEWLRQRALLLAELDGHERGRLQASILWAIHGNTIPASFWAIAHLLHDAEAKHAVLAELEEVAGLLNGEPPDLRVEVLDRLRMLDSAVRESLRLSSGSLTVRQVMATTVLDMPSGRWTLRKGDRVCLAPYFTHHDEEIFEEPRVYRHDRFHSESGTKQFFKGGRRVPLPLMPFGAGHSMCPGRFFAINEIKLLVAMILTSMDIELLDARLPPFDLGRVGLGIFAPAEDVRVRIRPL